MTGESEEGAKLKHTSGLISNQQHSLWQHMWLCWSARRLCSKRQRNVYCGSIFGSVMAICRLPSQMSNTFVP